jgi:uncharacterized protein
MALAGGTRYGAGRMTSPGAPRPILLASTWDPGLLPPLEMDGYLTGILVTPNLETRQ